MLVEVKKIDKLKRSISICVEGEDFLKDKNEAYITAGKNLKVPGFRPGAAPIEILEKHHGRILKEEFIKNVLSEYYQDAVREYKLVPAGYPDISDIEFTESGVKFRADFEVKPELNIEDKDYKGIKIKDVAVEIKNEEREKIIANLREGIKKTINRDTVDEEIARWAGYADFDKLKSAIDAELNVEKMHQRKRNLEAQIIAYLSKTVVFDLPQSVVSSHHAEMVEGQVRDLQKRGVSEADIEKYRKDLENRLKPMAEEEVKLFYILDAVAAKENLKTEGNLDVVLGYLLSVAQY